MTAAQPRPSFRHRATFRRLRSAPSLFLATVRLFGAEPEVRPEELPRTSPTAPENAASTLTVRSGFHAELMAAEPLVEDPITMAFDEDGRLYVVEMRDYSERREEKLGRVKLLEDTDGDGRYDKASIFADGLPWPTAVTCWDGGVFVIASPDLLYFKDTDGDRRADVHAQVFTGFGALMEKLNVQALPNSLQWGPDQRIHGALGGNPSRLKNFARFNDPPLELRDRDFSFDPRVLAARAETGGGQYGMSFDDAGRKFVCSNSRHIIQVMYRTGFPGGSFALPPPAVDIPSDGPQAEVFRTSPIEPWRILRTQWRVSGKVRGLIEGGGRAGGYFTSASGITIYRGDAFPPEYRGNAFIADPGSNLVHRKELRGDVQLNARRAPDELRTEFLTSSDHWFRPVAFANAPDGSLWFCDMYREVIEHPWSLPAPIKEKLDLNAGNDRGRLWRIVPEGYQPRPLPKLSAMSSDELVKLLAHPNGWHRDTAARLLHQRQDRAALPALSRLVAESRVAIGRITALRVLGASGALDDATLVHALTDKEPEVRAQAVRLCAEPAQKPVSPEIETALKRLATDDSAFVRYELSWALGTLPLTNKPDVLAQLLGRAVEPWLRDAALAAAGDHTDALLTKVATSNPARAAEIRKLLAGAHKAATPLPALGPAAPRPEAVAMFAPALELRGQVEKGAKTFETRCAMCHRFAGRGHAVGPDLDAARAAGREKILGNIVEPSREITAGFLLGIVQTTGGETLSGVIANDAPESITLRLPGGVARTVRVADLAKIERPPRSLMPDGIETGLTPQDMADLLEYLTAPGPRASLGVFQNVMQWGKRRAAILQNMQKVMGPLPGPEKRVPLEVQISEEVDCGTYLRRLLTYASEPGSRVPAYLLIPKTALAAGAAPVAAVLCPHPTDNRIGHKVVVGLGGKTNRAYAAELAELGFVTIAPSYPLLAEYQPDLEKLGYASGTMKAIWDNIRALDLLESLPFVQHSGFGAIGHSLGGHNSVFTAAFDERIKAVVTSCGLDSYLDYKGGDITGWTSTRYMPRLAEYRGRVHEMPFDFDEVLAAIAPRGVFISAPLHDDNFRADSVDRIAIATREIFALHNVPEELVVQHPDCAHDFPNEVRTAAYEWLSRRLKGAR